MAVILDDKTMELIAIGAAVAGNCEACTLYHIHKAADVGASVQEVMQAIDIGTFVKEAAAKRIEHAVERIFKETTEKAA